MTGYTLEDHIRIQREFNVGNTPIFELHNLTALARKCAAPGKGARIFVKDEASNPAGSFKERVKRNELAANAKSFLSAHFCIQDTASPSVFLMLNQIYGVKKRGG